MTPFTRTVAHYAALAMQPGFWQYAQAEVIALEALEARQSIGLWVGLRAAVGAVIKAEGFRPAQAELRSMA